MKRPGTPRRSAGRRWVLVYSPSSERAREIVALIGDLPVEPLRASTPDEVAVAVAELPAPAWVVLDDADTAEADGVRALLADSRAWAEVPIVAAEVTPRR